MNVIIVITSHWNVMNDILVSAQCFSISSCSLRFHCPCTWWGWWWCRVPVVALSMAMVPVSRECPCQLPAADHCAHCHQPDYLPAQSSHWSSHCTLSLIGFCSALIGCFHTGRHYVLMNVTFQAFICMIWLIWL